MIYAILFWTIAIVSAIGTCTILGAIALGAIKPEGTHPGSPRIIERGFWTKGTSGVARGSVRAASGIHRSSRREKAHSKILN